MEINYGHSKNEIYILKNWLVEIHQCLTILLGKIRMDVSEFTMQHVTINGMYFSIMNFHCLHAIAFFIHTHNPTFKCHQHNSTDRFSIQIKNIYILCK